MMFQYVELWLIIGMAFLLLLLTLSSTETIVKFPLWATMGIMIFIVVLWPITLCKFIGEIKKESGK
jgi:hypothetical protein